MSAQFIDGKIIYGTYLNNADIPKVSGLPQGAVLLRVDFHKQDLPLITFQQGAVIRSEHGEPGENGTIKPDGIPVSQSVYYTP